MKNRKEIKPFLKWAGGKTQLINEIAPLYPFSNGANKYAEPFVGGGAVLFDILSKYEPEQVYISDTNAELINTYRVIKENIEDLIITLKELEDEYLPMDYDVRKSYYFKARKRFNLLKSLESAKNSANIEKAALMIFLNKTCFNGLYRVNSKGEFNVPMGKYKYPVICDENNLRRISEKLQNVQIVCGDYSESASFIDSKTFVYFDPPYRPLTKTSSFTSYTESLFNDKNQRELAAFVDKLDNLGAFILVSNSDPKNSDENDDFFDNIYSTHNIKRIRANRMINCDGKKRGKVSELLISNY